MKFNVNNTNVNVFHKKSPRIYNNSSEFKGKLEIGNNSSAEFDSKVINIAELLTNSYKNLCVESDFVTSSAILINLGSNWAAELLPISSFPLTSEELMYIISVYFKSK